MTIIMIKLKKATIHKYKYIENPQEFVIESDIMVFIDMYESGKTMMLEPLAKFNNFYVNMRSKYNSTYDYLRKQKVDKNVKIPDAMTLTYEMNDKLIAIIKADSGIRVLSCFFSFSKTYGNNKIWSVNMMSNKTFAVAKVKSFSCDSKLIEDCLKKYENGA
jgi:hypothetical protein